MTTANIKGVRSRRRLGAREGTNLSSEVALLFPRQGDWTTEDLRDLPRTKLHLKVSNGQLIVRGLHHLPSRRESGVSRLTVELAWLFPRQGEWTEADYFALPEVNRFVELSDGELVIPDMPGIDHQRVIRELLLLMHAFVAPRQLGEVFPSPLPARLWTGKIREPDIMFLRAEHADRIHEKSCGVPDLAVEVISPRTRTSSGSAKMDRQERFSEYARAGVAEYWIIAPKPRTIEVFVLRNQRYQLLGKWGPGETARSEVLEGFEVVVDVIMPPTSKP